MPRGQAQKMQEALEAIAQDPNNYPGDWKPLRGEPYWRLRQGGYRAICSVESGQLTILVLKVGSRGDVYK